MKLRTMAVLLASVFAWGAFAAEPVVSGYFGDRSGVSRTGKPPIRWSDETNVRWKVPVPNLGNAAPAVAADRVFVLSEPGWTHDLPVISCYALADGQLLWEREIDHLSLTVSDDAERAKIRDAWHKHLAWIRDYYLLYHDYVAAKDSPEVKARMEAMGIQAWGANYLYAKADPSKVSEYSMYTFARKHPEAGRALLSLDTWRCMGSHDQMWIGEVFGTPITDGEAVYVATAWGVYASYDLNGNLRWMRAMPVNPPHDYCSRARSPLIYKDLLISDLGSMVRAFDRATGEIKWQYQRTAAGGYEPHEFVSPVAFRVGDQDILWCAGPAAYTLPEGKPLKIDGWRNNGMIVTVNTDHPDTLFFTGGGEHGGWEGKGAAKHRPPAAVRFTLDGDVLKARVLWSGLNGAAASGCVGMVYHQGRLYFAGGRGVILDAETGAVVKGLFGGAVPTAPHYLAIANGHIYGFSDGPGKDRLPGGIMRVYDLEGHAVATNTLTGTPFAALDADARTKRLSQWYSWPGAQNKEWCFTFSSSFTVAGDRILIRSLDHLYCLAGPEEAATAVTDPAREAETLIAAAEKRQDTWAQLAALGPAAAAVVPRIEALLPTHPEPWKPIAALAAIDPDTARKHRDLLVKAIVGSSLNAYVLGPAGETLYGLGYIPRALLAPIEALVDQKMSPIDGGRMAEILIGANYRRAGEVGFATIHVHPLPWEGVPERNEDIILRWEAVNATKVRIEPGIGEVDASGERTVRLTETTTYTFTAEGPGGPSVRTVTVPIKVGIRDFKAEPRQVAAGATVTLTWEVLNADGVTIEPGIGRVEASGQKVIPVGETTTFVLKAVGPGGPVQREIKVTVK